MAVSRGLPQVFKLYQRGRGQDVVLIADFDDFHAISYAVAVRDGSFRSIRS